MLFSSHQHLFFLAFCVHDCFLYIFLIFDVNLQSSVCHFHWWDWFGGIQKNQLCLASIRQPDHQPGTLACYSYRTHVFQLWIVSLVLSSVFLKNYQKNSEFLHLSRLADLFQRCQHRWPPDMKWIPTRGIFHEN